MHSLIFSFNSTPDAGRNLGAYRIAHILRENNWDVEVIDYMSCWTMPELRQLLRQRVTSETKFIGISMLYTDWTEYNNLFVDFCSYVKKYYPHVTLICGSNQDPHYDNTFADYYVSGYGENGLLALLKYLFSNGTRPRFELLTPQKLIRSNTNYPAYPLKSLFVDYQYRDFIEPDEWLSIETARGCKFQCAFCTYPILGVKGDYSRDAEDFKNQIQQHHDKYGTEGFIVIDETFNDRTEKITKFADIVQQVSFNPVFSGYIRADLAISRPLDREELLRMNFVGHYYGIETFHEQAGRAVGKGMNPERLKDGLISLKEYFTTNGLGLYRGTISTIVGLPHEPMQSIHDTYQWILDNWSDQAYVSFALDIPSSQWQKPSKISLDYKKYGYTVMSDDEIRTQESIERKWHKKGGLYGMPIYWKNEHMNYFEAYAIADEFSQKRYDKQYKFKTGNFTLGFTMPGKVSMKERFDCVPFHDIDKYYEACKQKANRYKQQKLSI